MSAPGSMRGSLTTSGGLAVVRAAITQSTLAAVDQLPGDAAERIRARLPKAMLWLVKESSRTDWLPIDIDIQLAEAILAVLGRERTAELTRRLAAENLATPIFKPILDGAVGIFGLAPEGILRWAPRAWDAIFRNCGALTVLDRGIGAARIACDGLPSSMRASRAFLDGMTAGFEVLFTITQVRGTVRFDEAAPVERPVMVFTWTPRAKR